MPDTSVLEETLRDVRTLYDEICREADEDQLRDDQELAVIARVGEKLAELQAKVHAQREAASGPDSAVETANPDQERWQKWVHVFEKLGTVSDDLFAQEHPLANGLAAILDKIAAAVAKAEYARATQILLKDAIWLVETHDLWAAVDPETGGDDAANLLPDFTKTRILKLADLRRVLNSSGHERAEEFAGLVDVIPEEVLEFSGIMPAALAVDNAWVYAETHDLWVWLKRADDEAMFWEHNGDRYRRLQNLLRSIAAAGHAFAAQLGERLEEVDKHIGNEGFYLAGSQIDEIWDLVRDRDLIEEGPKDVWDELGEDVAALEELSAAANVQHGLRDDGFPRAKALAGFVTAMKAAASDMAWQEALDQYKAGKAYADAQDLWTEIGIAAPEYEEDEDEQDENPAETRWRGLRSYYENVRDLYARLTELQHPLADRLGAMLDEIEEAQAKGKFQRAYDLLFEDVKDFIDYQDLWHIADPEAGNNFLPEITQEQIAKLRRLSRDLSRIRHEMAGEFAVLVSAIPRVVTEISALMPASRAVEGAWKFANEHSLWAAVPPLSKSEEERLFWENNGKLYRELNVLRRKLEEIDHSDAASLCARIADADQAIEEGQFHLADFHLDTAQEFADDRNLWDAAADDAADEDDDAAEINPLSASIGGSVGRGGKNDPADVRTVQLLLNLKGATLEPDGDCGTLTIRAIETFQKATFGGKDGRVDPDGRTLAALTGRAVIDDLADAATDVARKVTKTVTDTAETVVDVVGNVIGSAGAFLGGLLDGKGDADEKKT